MWLPPHSKSLACEAPSAGTAPILQQATTGCRAPQSQATLSCCGLMEVHGAAAPACQHKAPRCSQQGCRQAAGGARGPNSSCPRRARCTNVRQARPPALSNPICTHVHGTLLNTPCHGTAIPAPVPAEQHILSRLMRWATSNTGAPSKACEKPNSAGAGP